MCFFLLLNFFLIMLVISIFFIFLYFCYVFWPANLRLNSVSLLIHLLKVFKWQIIFSVLSLNQLQCAGCCFFPHCHLPGLLRQLLLLPSSLAAGSAYVWCYFFFAYSLPTYWYPLRNCNSAGHPEVHAWVTYQVTGLAVIRPLLKHQVETFLPWSFQLPTHGFSSFLKQEDPSRPLKVPCKETDMFVQIHLVQQALPLLSKVCGCPGCIKWWFSPRTLGPWLRYREGKSCQLYSIM